MKLVKSNSVSQIECNSSKQKNNAAPFPRQIPQSGGQNQITQNTKISQIKCKYSTKKKISNRPRQIPLPEENNGAMRPT